MTLPALPRLRRSRYWLLVVLAWLAFFAVRQLAGLDQHPLAGAAWAAIGLGVVGALTVARLHDRNRSGWWLAAVLIPLVGAAWLAFETALRRGTPAANAWGPDPRA